MAQRKSTLHGKNTAGTIIAIKMINELITSISLHIKELTDVLQIQRPGHEFDGMLAILTRTVEVQAESVNQLRERLQSIQEETSTVKQEVPVSHKH